ncbi:MAG: DNA adenine methylase [Actinomycetaceae bacterium]|nr:DNA adenine methylase [Actinomycetaceae bacterium]
MSAVSTRNSRTQQLAPIVKWVGGKRQLLPHILPLIPANISTYVEPFLGGGAVLFALQPKRAIVNDFNTELMNLYQVIRDEPQELIDRLREHAGRNNSDYFYEIRSWDRQDTYRKLKPATRAARLVYLNKTCYNGLFRVNQSGHFNTPFGRYKNPRIVDEPAIRALSDYLSTADIDLRTGDYRGALKNLSTTAFVYFDPPYMPVSTSASFTGYTEGGFDATEQIALRDTCRELNKQGIRFLLSNSAHPLILDLYSEFRIDMVEARRAVNSKAERRGVVTEVLVRNYELPK